MANLDMKWILDLAAVTIKLADAKKAGEGITLTADEVQTVTDTLRTLASGVLSESG